MRGIPEFFYDEVHRPNHFLNFAHSDLQNEEDEEEEFGTDYYSNNIN